MARLLAAAPQQTLPVLRGGRAARPNAECQPGYDGLPGGVCRRSQPCESRGEWRGHSSGRRVVAASVPTASAPAPLALAAECQPGYDGLPGGAQGLRAQLWGKMLREQAPASFTLFPQAVSACGVVGGAGPARPTFVSITIRIMITTRTVLGSTKLATKLATKRTHALATLARATKLTTKLATKKDPRQIRQPHQIM